MERGLIEEYDRELGYVRGAGAGCANHHPKSAARLGMQGTHIPDPDLERIIDAISLLSPPTQITIDPHYHSFPLPVLVPSPPHY